MSAIHVTEKILFERLYLIPGMETFGPWINCTLGFRCTHNSDYLFDNYFSIFVKNFPRMAPHFFVITIHQVIWPSPGTQISK